MLWLGARNTEWHYCVKQLLRANPALEKASQYKPFGECKKTLFGDSTCAEMTHIAFNVLSKGWNWTKLWGNVFFWWGSMQIVSSQQCSVPVPLSTTCSLGMLYENSPESIDSKAAVELMFCDHPGLWPLQFAIQIMKRWALYCFHEWC